MEKIWEKKIGSHLLSRVIGDLTSDGHLQLKAWRGLVSFYSNDMKAIESINKRFKSLFGINGRVYIKKGKNIQYRIFFISKNLALFLNKIGVPKGNKTEKPFLVPSWILKGSKKVQSAYLKGLFEGEGSIFPTKQKGKKPRWRIGIEMYKLLKYKQEGKRYMGQVKTIFKNMGIKTSPVRFGRKNKRKDNTYTIAVKLDIESKEFGKFYKLIGFDDDKKKEKLLGVIAEASA